MYFTRIRSSSISPYIGYHRKSHQLFLHGRLAEGVSPRVQPAARSAPHDECRMSNVERRMPPSAISNSTTAIRARPPQPTPDSNAISGEFKSAPAHHSKPYLSRPYPSAFLPRFRPGVASGGRRRGFVAGGFRRLPGIDAHVPRPARAVRSDTARSIPPGAAGRCCACDRPVHTTIA